MEDRNTQFTALGMSGSGKTCYIVGMYYVMAPGEKGWTIVTEDNITTDKINRWVKIIDDNDSGMQRFPIGTDKEKTEHYNFGLHYLNKPIMSFDWIDYAGGLFENMSSATFEKIEKSIENSTAIYIFIDGDNLCFEEKRKKVKNVRRNCATYIQPCITRFVESHDYMPPIVFVVTKSDLCRKYTDTEEIKDILSESFNSVFYDKNAKLYITAVSLGEDISLNDYTEDCDPIHMQIPFYIGIHHELVRRYKSDDFNLTEEDKENYRKMISNLTNALDEMKEDFLIVEGDIHGGHTKPFDPEEWRIF